MDKVCPKKNIQDFIQVFGISGRKPEYENRIIVGRYRIPHISYCPKVRETLDRKRFWVWKNF
jgi:hypothetical protein